MIRRLLFIGLFTIAPVFTANTVIALQEAPQANAQNKIDELRNLVEKVCLKITDAKAIGSTTIADDIEAIIFRYHGWNRQTSEYKKKIAAFFNENSEHFVCPDDQTAYPDQFLFQRIIAMGMYDELLISYFLEDENEFPIDVNTVYELYGTRQTVLDYVNSIIASVGFEKNYDTQEISDLRLILVEYFNAKTAAELLAGNR